MSIARMVELAYTRDLKSLDRKVLRVRIPLRVLSILMTIYYCEVIV